ncbi:alkaline phosphatase [Mucilaginibacter terrenus]|uniref:Alkaline phosphatase n=1 Tax=Mucilaginibacter terrenus TaxID=2482727 RepID=A0A3E2NQA7_9SPHI|nr:alkaline phosphatase [Mucilaginibacter terrenus]RFZ83172.1 alkaline phosphatase [Mucilaginibacter terrenus]
MKLHVFTSGLLFLLGFASTIFAQPRTNKTNSDIAPANIRPLVNRGHSHNDYRQNIPFLQAYYSGAGSIEADVYFHNGRLYVAHAKEEIRDGFTLDSVYLRPLVALFTKNNGRPYADSSFSLQLVIDIKEDHEHVIPELLRELAPYQRVFNDPANKHCVRVVLSGDMPEPAHFTDYPSYILFDGRPYTKYTDQQISRVAMISDAITEYTKWNGKGTLTRQDSVKLRQMIEAAHQRHKPFRFWATPDSPNSWIQLEKLGADWINTDHPQQLHDFYINRKKLLFANPSPYQVYKPAYKIDGANKKVKNVILIIGDGMGPAQLQAGQTANHGQLNITQCRFIGFSQTAASNSGNTDSAAGATAMATGHKTNNRAIGTGPNDEPLANLPDALSAHGIRSGIISSGDITDATPAAFYAHQPDRDSSNAIAADLLTSHVDVLIGSNQKSFLQNKDKGLMNKLSAAGYQLHLKLNELEKANGGKQLVLLSDADTRPVKDGRGDMLKTSILQTIRLLSGNKKGFFIMAEGAQIDYGGHANDLPYVVTELHDLDKTVAEALKFADEDGETLVIITADHETGGLTLLDASANNGMVLGSFSTNDHTSINVPVFAYGPHAQDFTGTYPNTALFYKILNLLKAAK